MITAIVIVLTTLAVAALLVWMVRGRHPEQAASHTEPDRHGIDRFYGNATDRPAGPDVDGQAIVGPGQVAPGPPSVG